MTPAYIQGFCKTAEAYGADPNILVKLAAIPFFARPKNLIWSVVRSLPQAPAEAWASIKPQALGTIRLINGRPLTALGRANILKKRIEARRTRLFNLRKNLETHFPLGMPESYESALRDAQVAVDGAAGKRLEALISKMRSSRDSRWLYDTSPANIHGRDITLPDAPAPRSLDYSFYYD